MNEQTKAQVEAYAEECRTEQLEPVSYTHLTLPTKA